MALTSLLPTLIVGYLVSFLVRLLGLPPELMGPRYGVEGNLLNAWLGPLFMLLVFAPLVETLLMGLAFALLRPIASSERSLAGISALV